VGNDNRVVVALMLENEGGPGGGAEVVVLELAEELRHRGYGVCPIVLTHEHEAPWLERQFVERGFEPERVRIRGPIDFRCLRDLVGVLRRRRVATVHSHEFAMTVYGTAAARWLRLPHVITLHGNMWMTDAWRRRVALRWAIRHSDATVAVSHDTRRQLLADLGLPDAAIDTVWNGIPAPAGERTAVRAELGVRPEEVLILAIGTLIERKGHAVLIRSLAEVYRRAPEIGWHLAIAGDGPERDHLATLAAEAGLAGRVRLLGFRPDAAHLLAAADVFAMPSQWEGLPLALLEAMFAGNAVIASGISGIPEAIPSEEFGVLVPPGDVPALTSALHRVLGDAALRSRLGRAAQARAREFFTVGRMTEAYLRRYFSPPDRR